MTPRLKFLIPAAASAALFAVSFANVARAQLARECFMECNRAPLKADTTSADHMPLDHRGSTNKLMPRRHGKMITRHKAGAISSDHIAP